MHRNPRGQPSPDRLRADLSERLQARRGEIERAILTRAYSVADPTEGGDPAYVMGLRAAVSAAVGYALAGIEAGDPKSTPIPPELFAQARYAARSGVSLDTVLRRYFAGHTLLGDFIMQAAERSDLFPLDELHSLGKTQAMLADRLITAISEEYRKEVDERLDSLDQRRTACAQRLLAGELTNTADLDYELEAWHLGAIAVGSSAQRELKELAVALDRRLLLISSAGAIWAWMGGSRMFDPEQLDRLIASARLTQLSMSVGEPAQGLDGWRLTHHQAMAALPIALHGSQPHVRYADVALLASMLQDEVLSRSLNDLYLAPLAKNRDGGVTSRETLRAYFAAERNISSAAAALGVSRKTVTSRLHTIEKHLGRPLSECAAEVEAALRLEKAGHFTAVPHATSSAAR